MAKTPMNFRMSDEAVRQMDKLVEYYSSKFPLEFTRTDLLHYAIDKLFQDTYKNKGVEKTEH